MFYFQNKINENCKGDVNFCALFFQNCTIKYVITLKGLFKLRYLTVFIVTLNVDNSVYKFKLSSTKWTLSLHRF